MILENPIHMKTYIWKKQEGCIITISEDGKKYILNPEYAMIWEEIDDLKTIEDIAQIVALKMEINLDIAIEKVTEMAKELVEKDLISFENYLWLEEDYV